MRKVLYAKIKEDIKNKIISDFYPLDTLLPPEKKLAEQYDVSLITLRRAIEELENEGYVQKKIAKGALVISKTPFQKIARSRQFTEILKNRQEDLEKAALYVEENHDGQYRDVLHAKNNVRIVRKYHLHQQGYIVEYHYFADSITKAVDFESLNTEDSIYQQIYAKGFQFHNMIDEFKAITFSPEIKQALDTKAALGIKRVRHGFDALGNVIHVMETIYDTEVYPYVVEFEV